MELFRIASNKYINDLSGEGARRVGGRWNEKGTPLIYTSERMSVCILEVLAHTSIGIIPDNLSSLKLFVPDNSSLEEIDINTLPINWKQYPYPSYLARIGSNWVSKNTSLLLKVPTVLSPGEFNILINPNHKEANLIKIISIEPFQFDQRLLKLP